MAASPVQEKRETIKLIGHYVDKMQQPQCYVGDFTAEDAARMGELCEKLAKILKADEDEQAPFVVTKELHDEMVAGYEADTAWLKGCAPRPQWTKEELAAAETMRINEGN